MGVLASGTVGGIALTSDTASATVAGEYTIPDSKATLTDSTLEDILLEVTANWNFESNADVHAVELELYVGATLDTADLISRSRKDGLGRKTLSGETTLTGSILSAADFDVENFTPTNGELTTGVVSELRFYALRHGEVAAEATQTEAFNVTVGKEELKISQGLDAQGEIGFNTST